jgi:hypothetical protein
VSSCSKPGGGASHGAGPENGPSGGPAFARARRPRRDAQSSSASATNAPASPAKKRFTPRGLIGPPEPEGGRPDTSPSTSEEGVGVLIEPPTAD